MGCPCRLPEALAAGILSHHKGWSAIFVGLSLEESHLSLRSGPVPGTRKNGADQAGQPRFIIHIFLSIMTKFIICFEMNNFNF